MSVSQNGSCFLYYDKLSPRLVSKATICYGEKELIVNAKWDTGATTSCVTQKVIDKLDLKPVGEMTVTTSNHTSVAKTYLIDIILPSNYKCEQIVVIGGQINNAIHDMLIGMDIISRGDFAVSNFNGRTTFTFRIPSKGVIDFTK